MLKIFRKNKLYRIRYEWICVDSTIISAKDEHQALKKFKKEMSRQMFAMPRLLSLEEIC